MNGLAVFEQYNSKPTSFAGGDLRPAPDPTISLALLHLGVSDSELYPSQVDLGAVGALARGIEVLRRFHVWYCYGDVWLELGATVNLLVSSSMRSTPGCQGGIASPKARRRLCVSSREFSGRRAGVG